MRRAAAIVAVLAVPPVVLALLLASPSVDEPPGSLLVGLRRRARLRRARLRAQRGCASAARCASVPDLAGVRGERRISRPPCARDPGRAPRPERRLRARNTRRPGARRCIRCRVGSGAPSRDVRTDHGRVGAHAGRALRPPRRLGRRLDRRVAAARRTRVGRGTRRVAALARRGRCRPLRGGRRRLRARLPAAAARRFSPRRHDRARAARRGDGRDRVGAELAAFLGGTGTCSCCSPSS